MKRLPIPSLQLAALALSLATAQVTGASPQAFWTSNTQGLMSPPWHGLRAPTDTNQTCLCGYVYNGAAVAWAVFENVPQATTCQAKCPTPTDTSGAFVPPPTFQSRQAKKCAAYTTVANSTAWTGPVTERDAVCEWYFPPKRAVADWTQGYSQSGTVTKRIHFFNWGTGADPAAITRDPNALEAALHGKGWTINYWFEQKQGTKLIPGTHFPRITPRPIGAGKPVTSAGNLLNGTAMSGRQGELDNLVQALVTRGQYALIKDLLVLAILYREGGYMIDNTFDIVDPQMRTPTNMDAVLTAGTRRATHCPIYVTSPGSGVGNQPLGDVPGAPQGVQSIFYELNIMYHPPQNAATLEILGCMMDIWKDANLSPTITTQLSESQKDAFKTENGTMHTFCAASVLAKCAQAHAEIPHLTAWLGIKGTPEQINTWRGAKGQAVQKGVPGATGRGRQKSFNGCLDLNIWKEYSK